MKYFIMMIISLNILSYTEWSTYTNEDKSTKSLTYTYGDLNKDAFHLRQYADGTWVFQVGSSKKLKGTSSVVLSGMYSDVPVILDDIKSKTDNDVFFNVSPDDLIRIKNLFFEAEEVDEKVTFLFYHNVFMCKEEIVECVGFKSLYRGTYAKY